MLPRVAAEAVVEGAEAGVGKVSGVVGAGGQLARQLAQLGQPVGLTPCSYGTLRCVAHECALRIPKKACISADGFDVAFGDAPGGAPVAGEHGVRLFIPDNLCFLGVPADGAPDAISDVAQLWHDS